jgi:EmrB/QacA subfamily drug resistance transporter
MFGVYLVLGMGKEQKLIIVISILASFVAFLDGSIINVALPAISHDIGGGLAAQQWIVDGYLLTLGSLILLAGSLSDIFGRKRILSAGLIGFGIASLCCAIAPNSLLLILFRGVQGIAGALLVPSSLALIISSFKGTSQGKAIGTWTAWTGIAFIIGPLLGGALVDAGSWRWVFAINVLPIGITLWLMRLLLPEEQNLQKTRLDITGAILCIIGLSSTVYALIEQPQNGWVSPQTLIPFILGMSVLAIFVFHERRIKDPMLPFNIFKERNFTIGNLATVAIYAALSVATFSIAIFLQEVGGFTAIQAGLALLPVTIIMFLLSPRFGALAGKIGPRLFMALGPIVAGLGFLSMARVTETLQYWSQLYPGIIIFGLGLSMTVAPLTSAVLGSINSKQAGIGSAINNAVARIAGLVGIAALGVIVGSNLTTEGFRRGMVYMAILLMVGVIISALGIQNKPRTEHLE